MTDENNPLGATPPDPQSSEPAVPYVKPGDPTPPTSQTSEPEVIVAPPTPDPSATVPVAPPPEPIVNEVEDVAKEAGAEIEAEAENLLQSLLTSHASLITILSNLEKAEPELRNSIISQGVSDFRAELANLKAILEKCATAS